MKPEPNLRRLPLSSLSRVKSPQPGPGLRTQEGPIGPSMEVWKPQHASLDRSQTGPPGTGPPGTGPPGTGPPGTGPPGTGPPGHVLLGHILLGPVLLRHVLLGHVLLGPVLLGHVLLGTVHRPGGSDSHRVSANEGTAARVAASGPLLADRDLTACLHDFLNCGAVGRQRQEDTVVYFLIYIYTGACGPYGQVGRSPACKMLPKK